MPFIDRHPDGSVSGVFVNGQRPGHEYVTDDDPTMVAWRAARQAERDAKAAEHNTAKDTIDAILAKAPADVTAAEIKLLVLKIAKYLRKRM